MSKAKLAIFLMGYLLAIPVLFAIEEDQRSQSATLIIESSSSGITYILNGKNISKKDGLLLALSRSRDADSRKDPELVLIASEKLPFMKVSEVMGIAGKARYFHFRTFIFSKNRRLMYQLDYSRPMPFSTNPAVTDNSGD
jgi:hypothetical protein